MITESHHHVQAGVASTRSLHEVASLETALSLLIKRASDIHDAKVLKDDTEMAARLAKLLPGASSKGLSAAHSLGGDHSMEEEEPAVHAEASSSKIGDVGDKSGKADVSATAELITPEVKRQLPSAAERVSL